MPYNLRKRTLLVVAALSLLATSGVVGCAESAPDKPAQPAHGGQPPETPGQEAPSVESTQVAVMTTSKGVMKLEFYPDVAPGHVENFVKLANEGFYDGVKWHRIVPGFVVQAGDPLTKDVAGEVVKRVAEGMQQAGDPPIGTGGPGYQIPAEFNARPHLRGTLAMARSADPDSGGSQFYICLAPQPGLDGQYTVFGAVIEGLEIIDALVVGDVIESVRIVERGK